MSRVKIVGNKETGALITPSKHKPEEYGAIRVETFGINGAGMAVRTSALISASHDILEGMVEFNSWTVGSMIEGGIIVEESHEPFYANQKPKTKGKDGEVVMKDGKAVYRSTRFVQGGDNAYAWVESQVGVTDDTAVEEEAKANTAVEQVV